MENDWYLWGLELRWPHQGVLLGYEIYNATDEQPYLTIRVHLLCISIIYETGFGDHPYK